MKDAPSALLLVLCFFAVGFGLHELKPHIVAEMHPLPAVGEIYMATDRSPFETKRSYAHVLEVREGWVKWSLLSQDDYDQFVQGRHVNESWTDQSEAHSFFYCYPDKADGGTP